MADSIENSLKYIKGENSKWAKQGHPRGKAWEVVQNKIWLSEFSEKIQMLYSFTGWPGELSKMRLKLNGVDYIF